MFKLFNLLFLMWLYNNSGSSTIPLSGIKGGNVTLSCKSEDREIVSIDLSRLKILLSCQNEECKSENVRVFKEGSCDIIIKDLRFSDAGKYILRVDYKNPQTELEPQTLEYQLCIQDYISVKKGEELKLDVLLINADKVVHLAKRSTGRKEGWRRGHGVSSDRMTIRDRNLIINHFTATDAGTYEVLDSEGQILIMVTVTESRTESKDELNYINDDKTTTYFPPST
ncbi:uncharacterized protein LOC143738165 [Siphateles boraxobius]|uniref:uncharacterized protein LOC143738165 n=1 Tax=Siphateles boraxobius TaxID=180520 RepID=UPI0040635104